MSDSSFNLNPDFSLDKSNTLQNASETNSFSPERQSQVAPATQWLKNKESVLERQKQNELDLVKKLQNDAQQFLKGYYESREFESEKIKSENRRRNLAGEANADSSNSSSDLWKNVITILEQNKSLTDSSRDGSVDNLTSSNQLKDRSRMLQVIQALIAESAK